MSKQCIKIMSIFFVLSFAAFAGAAMAEPTPDNTVLLIHSDVSSQSTVFTDSSSSAHPMTAVGNAVHAPGTKKFGQSAMYFDGAGDAVTTPDHADWDFAAGDFTIDYWMYPEAGSTASQGVEGAVSIYISGQYKGFTSGLHYGKPVFFCNMVGDNGIWSIQLADPQIAPQNQWTHIAVVRKGGTFTLYRNGNVAASVIKSGAVSVTSGSLNIGAATATYPFKGYLDEVRIVKSAVWSGPFTPPTTPYESAVVGPVLPTAPQVISAANSVDSLSVTWSPNNNPAGTAYFCENTTTTQHSGWVTTTTWNNTGLTPNTEYSFRVKARNAEGTESAWSTVSSFSTSQSTTPQDVKPSGDDRMIIKSDGKVGIGTTSPQSELAVNGKIVAKEVVVTPSGWADYVFEKDYPLKSLKAIDAYIQKNGKLPGIPSENEISQNGVNLSEIVVLQMAKIEELTLHMIRLEKEMERMKSEKY